jgi:hypothetical protein
MSGYVSALAVIGSDLYAGGNFSNAGGVIARNVARWDGTSWSAVGDGLNAAVFSLAVNGTDLYAGGLFSASGSDSVKRIAKWDGASWTPLGSGMDAAVWAIAINGTDLYAGGQFSTAGGVSAGNIAKWDGTSWSSLGSGMSHRVRALAVHGSDLYAGGDFALVGGVSSYIARWDGSSWTSPGSGLNGNVFVLTATDTSIFAGGHFRAAGGTPSQFLAQWHIPSSVGIDEVLAPIPEEQFLRQNYPNPFSPSTVIAFSLPEAGIVRLDIFDVAGRHVKTLLNGWVPAGPQRIHWRGTDAADTPLPSGVYIYRLATNTIVESRQMVLVR